jgi:hypothetical protein
MYVGDRRGMDGWMGMGDTPPSDPKGDMLSPSSHASRRLMLAMTRDSNWVGTVSAQSMHRAWLVALVIGPGRVECVPPNALPPKKKMEFPVSCVFLIRRRV